MKKYIYFLLALFVAVGLSAYSPDDPDEPTGSKTLIVYYSFTNNVHNIVSDLRTQIEADAKRLIPRGNFLEPSLWIRSSQTSNCHSMIANWLDVIN